MNTDGCMCKCKDAYKKMRSLTLFGIASIGIGYGLYKGMQKAYQIKEDKDYYRRYEEENPNEDYEARMEFYEQEFKRQDDEEKAELEKIVEEFNARRLNRENCPHCGNKQKVRDNRKRRFNRRTMKNNDIQKEEYENYIYLEK